jgi:hypothetical protein
MTAAEASARARVIDGLRAIEHDLRWENPTASAQIGALADRFEKDTRP